ncbi:MAG TPA: histidine kinase [Vicinamibacterales bacterium]|jgi:two-component system LytT family sensor kinase|nr:histidine kinase [Vicinamibacterales bacterium]
MTPFNAAGLLHIVGYLTGTSLYAMLLVMVARGRGPSQRLMMGTALLGLAWNLGELSAQLATRAGLSAAADWVSAVSYAALGFLAAVTVHAAGRVQIEVPDRRRSANRLGLVAVGGYGCAAIAGALQLLAAARGQTIPSSPPLFLLTLGLGLIAPALILTTKRQPHFRRALWMAGLALFAVSALHLGRFHGASEAWWTELLGHHASIPLAFVILYQDYRFAFADLFLKRALTLLALVTAVFLGWSVLAPSLLPAADGSPVVGVLLALWVGTALAFPWLENHVSLFVDRVVLKRANYAELLDDLAAQLQDCSAEEAVLECVCLALKPALSATEVAWRATPSPVAAGFQEIVVPVTEDPQPVLTVGGLAGGRRLLSDDTLLLERVARLAGRRLDALRLSDERYERMLREREMEALATEAELRALRAQINPHFLFNALTTLGYLIQIAPSRALDTLMRLTTLLRSVLRSEGEFTTLGHEQELIECYLQIERERFEERLDARVDIPAALAPVAIPSLIVQPLVENAIKHGIARARDGGRVLVTARMDDESDGVLQIVIANTGAPLQPARSAAEGIGLRNVQRRLECYYGRGGSLTLTTAPTGETVAELRIPTTGGLDAPASVLVDRARR